MHSSCNGGTERRAQQLGWTSQDALAKHGRSVHPLPLYQLPDQQLCTIGSRGEHARAAGSGSVGSAGGARALSAHQ